MFMICSRHRRNSLGVLCNRQNVNDEGLGIVVTQTTRFDPTRMRERFIYWLELAANEMAKQARVQMQEAGFDVEEDSGSIIAGRAVSGRAYYREKAIASIPFNEMSGKIRSVVAGWSAGIGIPKGVSTIKTYGVMAAKLAISYVMPWVGISMLLFDMFGGKEKPKMAIPWNSIYSQALSFAQETTVNEEAYRIIEEKQRTEQFRVKAVEKMSQEGALFKLPEGVTAIRRGALVMALKGPSVETKVG